MTGSDNYAHTDVDRLMDQAGRQLLEARMLPEKGPLSDKQRDQVRETLNSYIQKHGITQKEVCRQVSGISDGTLSGILTGTYNLGPLDTHLRALNDWMEVDARRRRTKPITTYVETRVAKRIRNCAQRASNRKQMVLAHGPTGIGKSMVAHVVAERFPGAIYIRISAGTTSFSAVRRMLATRLRPKRGRKPKKPDDALGLTLDERIFDKLRDSNRLIIIDEAHRISDGALEFLRDIYDECQTPMLLLCTKDLLDRVRQDNDEDHGQLYSRLSVCDLVKGFDKVPGGKNPLFTVAEIRKLFASDKVRLDPGATQYLQDAANMLGHGSLRLCHNIMTWAMDLERSIKGLGPNDVMTITEPLLRKAESEFKVDQMMLDDVNYRSTATVTAASA